MAVNILSDSSSSMAIEYFNNQEQNTMATTKSTKSSSDKPAALTAETGTVKAKAAPKPKAPAKAEAAAKASPKPTAAKPAKKPAEKVVAAAAGIPAEQRGHYVEVAAYYIAERRSFAPGNLLDDWVQAEAEIDRLLAEGHLGA